MLIHYTSLLAGISGGVLSSITTFLYARAAIRRQREFERRELVKQINSALQQQYEESLNLANVVMALLIAATADGWDGYKSVATSLASRIQIHDPPPIIDSDG